MKPKTYFSIVLFLALFVSCNQNSDFEQKNIDGDFTIELPTYMHELDLGIPEASLQYGNELEEHYVTVIRESPSALTDYGIFNLAGYADMYMAGVEMSIDDATLNQISDGVEQHNGMEAITFDVDGVLPENGLGIYYYIKFYKSETAYYYVLDWTLSDYKEQHLSDMKKITNSIKEL